MPQEENEKDDSDALRRYIDRLEEWPEDDPPSPADLRAIRREIRLTQDDRDKLEILSENHIRRARASQDAGAYDQAAAELARAAQLRPLDSRPRTELAGIYLQRSLERGYQRLDRNKAIRLARKALELNPGDMEARGFLREYRRMNADFRSAKYRKYLVPGFLALAALVVLAIWQRDWVVNLVRPAPEFTGSAPLESPQTPEDGRLRSVEVDVRTLEDGALDTEIIQAGVGRRNDASFVDIRGRIRSESATIGGMDLLLKGRDAQGDVVFAMPIAVRTDTAPLLRPGDSQSLAVFRWLAISDAAVDRLELQTLDADFVTGAPEPIPADAELVWEVPRPDGAVLEAEIRDMAVYEAFDRQVLLMDLALANTGANEFGGLSVDVSMGSRWAGHQIEAVNTEDAPLARGERRVWPVTMGFPLGADIAGQPVTVRITEASR